MKALLQQRDRAKAQRKRASDARRAGRLRVAREHAAGARFQAELTKLVDERAFMASQAKRTIVRRTLTDALLIRAGYAPIYRRTA